MRNQISRNHLWPNRGRCQTIAVSFSLALCLVLTASAALAKDEVAAIQKRTGKVADVALLAKRPPSGVVTDQDNWKSLWVAWRTGEEILNVDFENQIVLVATAEGPNVVLTSTLNLTPSGDLRYKVASTKKTGPGFGYVLLIIPKNRIVSVNGLKLAIAKPALTPADKPNQTTTSVAESIRVEIFGRVRTGVMSRSDSTGTMVVANGIVWELELGSDLQLTQAIQQLGSGVGNIRGTLSKVERPDRSLRWIVTVESIRPAGSSSNDTANDTALERHTEPPTISVSQQTGFESIVVSATGGRSKLERRQTVAADGLVTLEVPKTNYSDSFSLAANSLAELHTLVANTDWRSVPRNTATVGNNVVSFSITIETKSGTKRFFMDSSSINSQPVIAQLFSLMRKPKTDQ